MEKVPKSTIPDIDKKKFLVPADLSGMLDVLGEVVEDMNLSCECVHCHVGSQPSRPVAELAERNITIMCVEYLGRNDIRCWV